jgi:hypothetical protein
MADGVSRREAIGRLTAASAGVALSGGVLRGNAGIVPAQSGRPGRHAEASATQSGRDGAQGRDIVVAGRPVELVVSSVSEATVRVSVLPLDAGRPAEVPLDGSLVQATWGPAAGRIRDGGAVFPVRAGRFVVRYTPGPPGIHVETEVRVAGREEAQVVVFDGRPLVVRL